jgi:hypothetical protein
MSKGATSSSHFSPGAAVFRLNLRDQVCELKSPRACPGALRRRSIATGPKPPLLLGGGPKAKRSWGLTLFPDHSLAPDQFRLFGDGLPRSATTFGSKYLAMLACPWAVK